MLKLTKTEIGHGVRTERYTSAQGKRACIVVSTSTWGDGSLHDDHFKVYFADGTTSGVIYYREAAMRLAEANTF